MSGLAWSAAGLIGSWSWRHVRSPAVRSWSPSRHEVVAARPLAFRAFGQAPTAVLLLHGLGATGDFYGATYDRLARTERAVVPDLLGFGRSLDELRTDYSLDAHLDALDTLLADQAGPIEQITVVAHSMGSALGLAWAARHPQRVSRVLCCGAPIYADRLSATEGVAGSGPMARLFALDSSWARKACSLSCAHRTAAGFAGALAQPGLPVAITRQASLHTWAAFNGGMDALILRADWTGLLDRLHEAGVPVTLVWGTEDRIGDVDVARAMAHPQTQAVELVLGADHHLPITHASWVVEKVLGERRGAHPGAAEAAPN